MAANWFTNLFAKANEIGRLDKVIADLTSDKFALEVRLELTEKDLKRERDKHVLALRRTADMLCRQNKLPEHFVKDIEPPKETVPEQPSLEEVVADQKIEWAAQQMIEQDKAMNIEPMPIAEYIAEIKKDPQRYLL